jgi:hypothetical protein
VKTSVVYAYVLAANSSLDRIDCHVPCLLPENKIFFGSCMKKIRKHINNILKDDPEYLNKKNVYLVGISGSKASKQKRVILWAGRIIKKITFEEAYKNYKNLKSVHSYHEPELVTHLKPNYDDYGKLTNYTIRERATHHKNMWRSDFKSKNATDLDLDICFECDCEFFALNQSIDISNDILKVFRASRKHQEQNITDSYHVFGRDKNGSAIGLRGFGIELEGQHAAELIDLIRTNQPGQSANYKSLAKSKAILPTAGRC